MKVLVCGVITGLALSPVAGVRSQNGRQHSLLRASSAASSASGSARSAATASSALAHTIEVKYGSKMRELLNGMLTGKGPGPGEIAKLMHSKMDIKDAMQQLDGKLPEDVASLVRMSSEGQTRRKMGHSQSPALDEDSLQKARAILNNMIFDAWKQLDDVVFECKEFQERNRGTYEQVVTDITRLGAQLAGLGEIRVEANEGIAEQDKMRKETEGEIQKTTTSFNAQKLLDDQEMTIRKNDLAVFDMILMMTQCQDQPTSLMQLNSRHGVSASLVSQRSNQSMRLCMVGDTVHIELPDARAQAKVERMMTNEAKLALHMALGQVVTHNKNKMSFLEVGDNRDEFSTDGNATEGNIPTTMPPTSPVSEAPDPNGQARKCVDGTPNCGLLHDLMSMEWGKFRDSFDVLATQMQKNQDAYDKFMENMNAQLTTFADTRTKHMEALAAAISATNADTEEMGEKDLEKRDLQEEHDKKMAEFKAACTEILFTNICGVRTVRNNIMKQSTLSPPSNISDCDFGDWFPKDGVCIGIEGIAIECDDTCPQDDPYKCGGLETMKRDVVVTPNQYGMPCPQLERPKKCNQFKCPVDCVLSEWSGWSKCTKECEGGVKVRTRSLLTKAKNGGKACDTVQEEEGCNTDSCDRDCSLDAWTTWSPCTMACGGGESERLRHVTIPIRGQGKCPTARSADRYEKKTCNDAACVGDEVCIAKQDLVLAIDASGSLRQSGFDVVRDFASNLTTRYQSKMYGQSDMQVGVVLFGNGHLNTQPDGSTSISDAVFIQGCTADLDLVRTQIDQLTWQKGFTNMAQGFQMADVVLSQTGRADAQSAVLVLSDGKYSMEFQTAEKAQELKDKNIKVFLAPITEVLGADLHTFRSFSSTPHETNFERIPGLQALEYNIQTFAGQLVAKFCPVAVSPSQLAAKEEDAQYMLVAKGAFPDQTCSGAPTFFGSGLSLDGCLTQARDNGDAGFAFHKAGGGDCYGLKLYVSDEYWNLGLNFTNKHQFMCPHGYAVQKDACCAVSGQECGPGSTGAACDYGPMADSDACAATCDAQPWCNAFVFQTSTGNCFLESACTSNQEPCDGSGDYTRYRDSTGGNFEPNPFYDIYILKPSPVITVR